MKWIPSPRYLFQLALLTIGFAKIATSADEAKHIGYLLKTDTVVLNNDHRIWTAKQKAIELAKKFLSYLPSSIDEVPDRLKSGDPVNRTEEWLIKAVPKDRRAAYDMHPIINSIERI